MKRALLMTEKAPAAEGTSSVHTTKGRAVLERHIQTSGNDEDVARVKNRVMRGQAGDQNAGTGGSGADLSVETE